MTDTTTTHAITQANIARIGRALFGEQWTAAMADLLGINRKTVQRWMREGADYGPHVNHARDLAEALIERAEEVSDLLQRDWTKDPTESEVKFGAPREQYVGMARHVVRAHMAECDHHCPREEQA
jgi:DNA-binding XRE family transcriptional regulator